MILRNVNEEELTDGTAVSAAAPEGGPIKWPAGHQDFAVLQDANQGPRVQSDHHQRGQH